MGVHQNLLNSLLCLLLVLRGQFSEAKRWNAHSQSSAGKHSSISPLFPRTTSGIEASGRYSGGLPFIDPEITEKQLERRIAGYAEKKNRVQTKLVPQESYLKDDLLFNDVYDRTSRPVRDDKTVMVVKAGISLYHVLDVEEKLQLLSCVVAIRLSWFDEFLTWNISQYSNITSILLPSSLIWLPDVVVLNNAEFGAASTQETNVIVSNDGFVLWMFPSLIKTFCYLDLSWFPFDEQNCDVLMSPLTYDIRQMNFTTSASNNASYYDERGQEWTVVSILASRIEVFEPLTATRITRINFEVRLKRKALFYMYTCIFPCALIYFVSLLSFFVPVTDQGGKIELPLTSLLSIVVLQMSISDTLAATDIVPLISKMYAWTMLQCCTSLVFSVVTTVIARQRPKRAIPKKLTFIAYPEVFLQKYVVDRFFTRRKQKGGSVSSSSSSSSQPSSRAVHRGHRGPGSQQLSPSYSSNFEEAEPLASFPDSTSSTFSALSSSASMLFAMARNYTMAAYGGAQPPTYYSCQPDNNNTTDHNFSPSTCSMPSTANLDDCSMTLLKVGNFFIYSRDISQCTAWERVGKRINILFLVVFLILTFVGYAMCLPSLDFIAEYLRFW